MAQDWKGKVAVVTGGSSGIGLAISRMLAELGLQVVIGARQQDRNEEVAAALAREFGVRTRAVETDVSEEGDCERLMGETIREFGTVDVLVNNAGIGGWGAIAEASTEDFERVLRTNLYGTFWCARAAYRQMRRNGGNPRGWIVNVSSLAGKQAWKGTGVYSASKFGIQGLTYALADEGKEDGIKTVAICPAMVATPMTGVSGAEYLQPEDIAGTVRWLLGLSPAAWPVEVVLERKDA